MIARRIKVTGCLNCPYHKEHSYGDDDKGLVEFSYFCEHPSFGHSPRVGKEYVHNLYDGAEGENVRYMPNWCPLEVVQEEW